ncbi:hypothetical protein FisN_11Lh181 [Fistulifera solaris]|uniref:16S rRNA (uracil(1498)-N(3))-methyltransferase n=1 Tax=Fistulifera solaris TaxID=1519565 RepID=A0A1Z5J7T5_FISSO|nr:hypothetical protein FisN_11Lh181 [Fistulifera solaris]|eukprot:GAX09841.1 hypothetical protein FisN_11Lh181 [Fistulifera solaris]
MHLVVRTQRPRICSVTRSTASLQQVRLHSSLNSSDKVVGKSEGYSKLPRLYVGSIPTEPTSCTHIHNLPQLFSSAPASCRANAILELTPEQSRYLITVLRWNKRKSDIRVFDQRSEWLARVSVLEDKRRNPLVTVECTEPLRIYSGPVSRPSILCIAPPKKKERLRWLMEKTVELGVDGFLFLDTEYSEASSIDFDKVQSYVLEAVEQSERLNVPIIFSAPSLMNHSLQQEQNPGLNTFVLRDFLQIWQESAVGNALITRERADTVPILEALQGLTRLSDEPIMFLVGPEGGWSPAEEEMMDTWEAQCQGRIRNVSLGNTILRSETAAMTAIAAYSLVKSN